MLQCAVSSLGAAEGAAAAHAHTDGGTRDKQRQKLTRLGDSLTASSSGSSDGSPPSGIDLSRGIGGRGRASTAAAAASCARRPAVAVSSGWLSALTRSDTAGRHLHVHPEQA